MPLDFLGGGVYEKQGRFGEAEPVFRRMVRIIAKALDDPRYGQSLLGDLLRGFHGYSVALVDGGKRDVAMSRILEAAGPSLTTQLEGLHQLGTVLEERKLFGEADRVRRRALEIAQVYDKTPDSRHDYLRNQYINYARLALKVGRYDTAAAYFAHALAAQERVTAPDDPSLLRHLVRVEGAYRLIGREQAAASAGARALRIFRKRLRSLLGAAARDSVIGAGAWNFLCWWGSLAGRAEMALPACEEAVAAASEQERPAILDSRGLAKALAGDTASAIADFEAYLATRDSAAPDAVQRRAWVAALRAGRDPFTEDELNKLRF